MAKHGFRSLDEEAEAARIAEMEARIMMCIGRDAAGCIGLVDGGCIGRKGCADH